jgi:hypothetical protein
MARLQHFGASTAACITGRLAAAGKNPFQSIELQRICTKNNSCRSAAKNVYKPVVRRNIPDYDAQVWARH